MGNDREAIFARRAKLLATAFAGLAIPVAAGACSDPKPCLSIAMVPSSSQPSDSAAPVASTPPSAATSAAAPGPAQEGGIAVTAEEAQKLGLPRIGFRATMKKGGWSITGPTKERYAMASGPPGGPLIFRASPYDDTISDRGGFEPIFRKAISDFSALDPVEVGQAEFVTLGGKKLEAQAFKTGKGITATNWCAVKAPAGAGARTGVLFLFAVGTGDAIKPACKVSLEHEAIAEIVATLKLEEG